MAGLKKSCGNTHAIITEKSLGSRPSIGFMFLMVNFQYAYMSILQVGVTYKKHHNFYLY
jgi:hypothetical protein